MTFELKALSVGTAIRILREFDKCRLRTVTRRAAALKQRFFVGRVRPTKGFAFYSIYLPKSDCYLKNLLNVASK